MESKILGCYFHLKQALFRKLKKLLPQVPDIYLVLKLIGALTLVKKEEINDVIDFTHQTGRISVMFPLFGVIFRKYVSKTMIQNY
ncbi:hypothetical protein HZS_5232 [Henneguya salminicola]|nr:hypothetical protein HZS_5232 [Henneguya salminicola]